MKSELLALSAILLWGSLAALGVSLSHVPPFLLTGLGLLVGSLIAYPLSGFQLSRLRVPPQTLILGVYGLFGFHLLLFIALRTAPAVEANLINYLWPLGMVVLAPLLLPGTTLRGTHVFAALMGLCGAAIAILGQGSAGSQSFAGGFHAGYLYAFGSAIVWATYSLLTRRITPFSTAAVGSFAAVSGGLSLLLHVLFEPSVSLSVNDLLLIAMLGLGPLGGAFFLWDAALKVGDPRRIGLLAFMTPLLSTVTVVLSTGQDFSPHILVAAALIVSAAAIGRKT